MKCSIKVTGSTQAINSVRTIVSTIERQSYRSSGVRKGVFNTYYIDFFTLKDARKALWDCYKDLRIDHKEIVRYSPGFSLSYDAGRAEITTL